MIPRLRPYFELIRPANVCTAIADVTAGALYMGARFEDWREWVTLAGASAMIYAGGVTLNDACDARRDAIRRPERPIPSGRVSRRAAFALSAGLLVCGAALAGLFSTRALSVAGALVVAIVLYNAALKLTVLGPFVMGSCRALNLALGMTIIPEYRTVVGLLPVWLLVGLYVGSITLLARDEHTHAAPWRLRLATTGLILAVLGLGGLLVLVPRAHPDYLIGVGMLMLIVLWRAVPAMRRRDASAVQRAVADLILSLVLFNACIVWAARGFALALPVLVWIVPAKALSRAFRVT